jgi:multidrug resistance efflux pump
MKPLALLLLLVVPAFAQDDLPQRDVREAFDFEPSLRLYDVKREAVGKTIPWEAPLDVDKARSEAESAKLRADRWQQLQRKGVVSKVEAERSVILANRAAWRYQQARVVAQQAQVDALKQRVSRGEASPDLLTSAEIALRNSTQLAAEAEALARRTELEFAKTNLERQRRLSAAGLGAKTPRP